MSDIAARIAENVAAGPRSGLPPRRPAPAARPSDVTLVAVTKYVSAEVVRPLVAAGCVDLGESRPQQLWEKAAALADLPIRWHLIGHLQRNKVRRTLPLVAMIHSVDSPRLLAAIDEEWACTGGARASACSPLPVLLEVNISGEAAKHGFAPETIEPLLAELAGYRQRGGPRADVHGRLGGRLDAARRDFAALRQLRDRLRPRCPPGVTLDELSMGMSGDFEVAIEEGATIVRVGSALFEGMRIAVIRDLIPDPFVIMLALEPHPDGTILPVRAQPGARRNEIRGVQDGMLKVCVTQSPEKGKANKAIVRTAEQVARAEEIADRVDRRRNVAPEAVSRARDQARGTGRTSGSRWLADA